MSHCDNMITHTSNHTFQAGCLSQKILSRKGRKLRYTSMQILVKIKVQIKVGKKVPVVQVAGG